MKNIIRYKNIAAIAVMVSGVAIVLIGVISFRLSMIYDRVVIGLNNPSANAHKEALLDLFSGSRSLMVAVMALSVITLLSIGVLSVIIAKIIGWHKRLEAKGNEA